MEMLAAIYPPPARVVRSRRNTGKALRFIAFPSVSRARILVSAGYPRVSSRAIARQLSGRRRRTRIARAGVSAAARLGILGLLPGSNLTIANDANEVTFERVIARRLGVDEVHLTLPIGPARANRKPILQISDRYGDPVAYAKVGHNDLTRSLVHAEGRALRVISGGAGSDILTPKVLDEFDWHGSRVLLLSPLEIPTSGLLSGRQARERLVRVTQQIAVLGGPLRSETLRTHPVRDRLRNAFAKLGDRGSPFLPAADMLDDDTKLDFGSWHGDFNVGNFALTVGPCPVWDWERFEVDVPVGFDVLHHAFHSWITIDRLPPDVAARRLVDRASGLLEGAVAPEASALTARVYLLTLGERYLRDDQESAGVGLGAVSTWLLPVFEPGLGGRGIR